MRISVNLATRPFVELRPMFAKLRLVLLGLALVAVALGFAVRSLNAKARASQTTMDKLKAETLQFQQERQRNEARMHQPENMAVLERSQFLNALFAQKSFSWTAVMMDLERVLPAGVQVTSIEPAISKEGEVSIRLRVSGEREKAIELIKNLESSQRFIGPRLTGESAMAQEMGRAASVPTTPGAVELEILSGYNPLPEPTAKAKKTEVAANAEKDETRDADRTGAQGDDRMTVSRRARGRDIKRAPVRQRHLLGEAR